MNLEKMANNYQKTHSYFSLEKLIKIIAYKLGPLVLSPSKYTSDEYNIFSPSPKGYAGRFV